MWVYRRVLYVRPGLIAEAIAHVKGISVPEGTRLRMLRPINGAEAATQLIVETEFEDLDVAFANHGRPGPLGEAMKRWIELNQSRGQLELYKVAHAIPSQGQPGLWVDRRERWQRRGMMGEALDLWRTYPRLDVPGFSFRALVARTGKEAPALLVVEATCASLAEHDAALGRFVSTPEGTAFRNRMVEIETREADKDLLRVAE